MTLFAVEVRDHIMIAHSFRGSVFGPAQALHGATFVVDAAFFADALDPNGIVVDIGRAHEALKAILDPINYRNLDQVADFDGANTTTEYLTRHVFEGLATGDIRAFSAALRRLIQDTCERHRLAAVAWASANTLSTWEQAAEQFSHAIETVA
jgi:6-pyruvoyl-tetrahydropterin synthase